MSIRVKKQLSSWTNEAARLEVQNRKRWYQGDSSLPSLPFLTKINLQLFFFGGVLWGRGVEEGEFEGRFLLLLF